MLRNCTASRYAVNKERMVRLSEYSRDCLDELRAETGIAYESRTLGTTQLFRTQAQLDAAAKDIAVLEQSGVPYELLDRDAIARVEPALAGAKHLLAGALRLPNDQTGDCQLFTTQLAEMAISASWVHPTRGNGRETGCRVPLRAEHPAPGSGRRPTQRRVDRRQAGNG